MGVIHIPVDAVKLGGDLFLPSPVRGVVVLFAHGSGSSRSSPRNLFVARILQRQGIGTLLFDLLTREEDQDSAMRFDIGLLTQRLIAATTWLKNNPEVQALPLGYFGASTGAAAALQAAAELGKAIAAVVSRGGRPDLAGDRALRQVMAPTLFIVGDADYGVIELNQQAFVALQQCTRELTWYPVQRICSKSPGHWKRLHNVLPIGF